MALLVDILATGVIDDAGCAVDAGKVYVYKVGTTTKVNIFSDSDLAVQISNPIILSSSGKAEVYINEDVRLYIEDADGNLIDDIDAIGSSTSFGGNTSIGSSSADVLILNSSIQGDLLPQATNQFDIGSSTVYWDDAFIDTLNVNNVNVLGANISSSKFRNLAMGIEFEGTSGNISTTAEVFAKVINQGAIVNAASLSSEDFNEDDLDATNVKFGKYSYALDGSTVLAVSGVQMNRVKGSVSCWFRNFAISTGIACNPLTGHELYLDASGYLTAKITEKTASDETTKDTKTVAGTQVRSGNSSFRHAAMKWRVNNESGATTDILELDYNGSNEGAQIALSDISSNPGTGGTWFFGARFNEPVWDHVSAMSVLPDAEATSPWLPVGSFDTKTVSDGIFSMSCLFTDTFYMQRSNFIDLENQTLDWKMRVEAVDIINFEDLTCVVSVVDSTANRGVAILYTPFSVIIQFGGSDVREEIIIDTSEYHVYRLTSDTASYTTKFYIDGVLVFSEDNSVVDGGSSEIIFGDDDSSSGGNSTSHWEHFKVLGTSAEPPLTLSTQGNIDSIALIKTNIDDITLASLQGSQSTEVFGTTPTYGVSVPTSKRFDPDGPISTGSTVFVQYSNSVYYVQGDGVSEFMFHANMSMSSAGGNCYSTISVDGDMDGKLPTYRTVPISVSENTGVDVPVPVVRPMVLSPGLHKVSVQYASSSGTVSSSARSNQFHVTLNNKQIIGD